MNREAEKQEPVAWHEPGAYGNVTTHKDWALANGWEPLYAALVHASDISQECADETAKCVHEFECPRCGHCCQQREWVGLTDEERLEVASRKWWHWEDAFDIGGFARAIEAKLKEKNTYTAPVHDSDISQEFVDETAKHRHETDDDIYDIWKEKNT